MLKILKIASLACLALLLGCGGTSREERIYQQIDVKGTKSAEDNSVASQPALSSEQMALLRSLTGNNIDGSPTAPTDDRGSEPLRWTIPDGWTEEAGSGMRLATLKAKRDGKVAETSLVMLGGGGSIEANLKRWVGQISDKEPDSSGLMKLVEKAPTFETEGGLKGMLVDLGPYASEASDSESMLVGIVPMGERQLFVKMTGQRSILDSEKESLLRFCKSLR